MQTSRTDNCYRIQEIAYLDANSFESKNPLDPFLKYRLPDGSFKWWLHTWRLRSPGSNDMGDVIDYWSPLPWVWDEKPDGEVLMAYKAVGYLKKVGMGWESFTPPSPGPYTVYHKLLPNINSGARDSYIAGHRKHFVSGIDFIAWMGRTHALFNKPKER